MQCPNCGLANPAGSRFCANCGTSLAGTPPQAQFTGPQQQAPPQWQTAPPPAGATGLSFGRIVGWGCLVLVVLFLLSSLSCMRACFWPGHRYYMRGRKVYRIATVGYSGPSSAVLR